MNTLPNRLILQKYLRHNVHFPHIWCPGCGNGIFLGALLRAIERTGYHRDQIVLVGGIGCIGRATSYVDFNTVHTAHGRALPFATGIKAANPALKVIAIMGDGDAVAIGGNHLIHACRRNIDVTALVVNNFNYGMTGGQMSPTTPEGARTPTSPGGSIEEPFHIADLAACAGASFSARATTFHVREMESLIFKALSRDGFSMVEVISSCPAHYGANNGAKTPVEMMRWQKEYSVPVDKAAALSPEERKKMIITGIIAEREVPGWTEKYRATLDGKREK
ncbi:2-oxoacid:ferredoxin oxidoreductase subunit beta [bacterium]|nr:MAG: 2-oxoacid:ferredoxin oxidoreductase subunit beta [bacterium]